MKIKYLLIVLFIAVLSNLRAQESEKNIIEIIDDLTVQWDEEAKELETYNGLQKYCRDKAYRDNTVLLLNTIHHYDSSLYKIVTDKYANNQDPEAKATLDDIETLELDYATKRFLNFLRRECMTFNDNENNKNIEGYDEMVAEIEAEMVDYVEAITKQIDMVDEHVHHLKDL